MIFIEHGELNQGAISVVTLKGQLDSATAADFEAFIVQLLDKERRLSSSAWNSWNTAVPRASASTWYLQKKVTSGGGMLVLQGLSVELKTLFTILGFDRLVSLADSPGDAQAILEKHIQFVDRPAAPAGSGTGPSAGETGTGGSIRGGKRREGAVLRGEGAG